MKTITRAASILGATTLIFSLSAPAAMASTHALASTESAADTQEGELDLGVPEDVFIQALDDASAEVPNPSADPDAFEGAMTRSITAQGYGGQAPPPGMAAPQALPAVIIAARIGGCLAAAYGPLSSLDANAPYTENAANISSAVVGCVGGGVSGQAITNWLINNPRTAGAALNAVGLGHLSGDTRQ